VDVSLRHGGAHGDAFATAVTTRIVLRPKKSVEVCLPTTKSTRRALSYAFVLYRELFAELSHSDIDSRFTDRITLICPSLPPNNN